jgi:hypothetical protein
MRLHLLLLGTVTFSTVVLVTIFGFPALVGVGTGSVMFTSLMSLKRKRGGAKKAVVVVLRA